MNKLVFACLLLVLFVQVAQGRQRLFNRIAMNAMTPANAVLFAKEVKMSVTDLYRLNGAADKTAFDGMHNVNVPNEGCEKAVVAVDASPLVHSIAAGDYQTTYKAIYDSFTPKLAATRKKSAAVLKETEDTKAKGGVVNQQDVQAKLTLVTQEMDALRADLNDQLRASVCDVCTRNAFWIFQLMKGDLDALKAASDNLGNAAKVVGDLLHPVYSTAAEVIAKLKTTGDSAAAHISIFTNAHQFVVQQRKVGVNYQYRHFQSWVTLYPLSDWLYGSTDLVLGPAVNTFGKFQWVAEAAYTTALTNALTTYHGLAQTVSNNQVPSDQDKLAAKNAAQALFGPVDIVPIATSYGNRIKNSGDKKAAELAIALRVEAFYTTYTDDRCWTTASGLIDYAATL